MGRDFRGKRWEIKGLVEIRDDGNVIFRENRFWQFARNKMHIDGRNLEHFTESLKLSRSTYH